MNKKFAFDLKFKASFKTFHLMRTVDPNTCINTLISLKIAVQGKRQHHLDSSRKQELKEFYRFLNKMK